MIKAIFKRILFSIPTLLLVVIITFLLARVVPGDPVAMIAGDTATEEQREKVIVQLGLDKPLYVQFIDYCKDLLQGDFGYSWHSSNSVADDFKTRLPATLELALWAMFIAVIVGIPLGILSAIRKNSLMDHLCRIISMIGSSMPIFWLGLMLIYYLFYKMRWFPAPMGRLGITVVAPAKITGMYVLDALLAGDVKLAGECAKYLVLPSITLSMGTMSILARMTRTSMLETLNMEYVRTAKAKGLRPGKIIWKHAFTNALIPILTVLGGQFGVLMGSTVVCESIFSWPGLGTYLTQSILATDYNPVQAFTLLTAVMYVLINLVLDILYTVVDPRVRLE